ncbi:RlpA-like double-psi beta-barrel-protein domain-containing protein-containing protein [Cladochytrium replicatum]|nr:RlpA-like double-psi beta-barrel-protein domain-containing protein-containing protein [Cladochytrium replicatum]
MKSLALSKIFSIAFAAFLLAPATSASLGLNEDLELESRAGSDIFSTIHSGKMTFFGTGSGSDAPPYCPNCGACGKDPTTKFHKYYVALSHTIYTKSACRQCIRVTCNDSACVKGRSVVLEVADSCPPCSKNSIDASLDGMAALMSDGKKGAKRAGVLKVKWTGAPCSASITSALQLSDFNALTTGNATEEFEKLMQPPSLPVGWNNAECKDSDDVDDIVRFNWADTYSCCTYTNVDSKTTSANCTLLPALGTPVEALSASTSGSIAGPSIRILFSSFLIGFLTLAMF